MKKNVMKMMLDIAMIVILALLYNSHVAAMSFHEIAGIGLFGLFAIHCLINLKWIIAISKRFFSKSLSFKIRIGYIVNLFLAVTFIFEIISGICTSQVLFPAGSHSGVWRGIHHFCGAVSIVLVGVHLGLHWSFVTGMIKKAIRVKSVAIRKIISMILLAIVLFFGVYNIASSSFANWFVEPFITQVKTETHTENNNSIDSKKMEDVKNRTLEKQGESDKTVNTNPVIILGTIAKFISIMGVFAVLIYYFEKFSGEFFKRKKK